MAKRTTQRAKTTAQAVAKPSSKPASASASKPARKKTAKKAPARKAAASKPAKQALKTVTKAPEVPASQAFAIELARMVRDDKCENVLLLDVRQHSQVTDYIIIGSGTSDRQMRSVLKHAEELGEKLGSPSVRATSDDRATWLLADFVDVILHLFEPTTRSHYDLEMLWGDAPRLPWERPDQVDRDRAGLSVDDDA